MPGETVETNGKVGLKDFYEKLEQTNKAIQESEKQTKQAVIDSERRILEKIEKLTDNGSPIAQQAAKDACKALDEIDTLDERMDEFVLKYNVWNGLNSTLVIIAGWLGFKQ